MLHPHVMSPAAWPLSELCVKTPRLTLRLPADDELMRLADRAAGRLLSPEQAGFMSAWAQLPSPQFERSLMQFHWGLRAEWSPSNWSLALGIYPPEENHPVGGIDASANEFARTRGASVGWWLLPEWRGRGLGKEALAGMLHLVFDGLDGVEARSIIHPQNAASLVIHRALGYRTDGTERTVAGDGRAIDAVRMVLRRDDWLRSRRTDIAVSGLEACAELFGL